MTEMQLFLTIICTCSIFRIYQLKRERKDHRKCRKYIFMQTNQYLTIIRTVELFLYITTMMACIQWVIHDQFRYVWSIIFLFDDLSYVQFFCFELALKMVELMVIPRHVQHLTCQIYCCIINNGNILISKSTTYRGIYISTERENGFNFEVKFHWDFDRIRK